MVAPTLASDIVKALLAAGLGSPDCERTAVWLCSARDAESEIEARQCATRALRRLRTNLLADVEAATFDGPPGEAAAERARSIIAVVDAELSVLQPRPSVRSGDAS